MKNSESEIETYQVRYPGNGRLWTLRRIPKHFYLMYGQTPTSLTEEVAKALETGDEETLEKEIESALSPEQLTQTLIFVREAVNFACLKPKLSLTPSSKDEISPLELSEEEFNFLSKIILFPRGAEAERLRKFRVESDKSTKRSASGKKLRKKSK